MDPELEEAIIRVAYGEAGFRERRRVKRLAINDKSVADTLDQYRGVAGVGRMIASDRCPAKVCQQVGLRIHNSRRNTWNPYPFLVPVGALAIAGILFINNPARQKSAGSDGYTEVEIRQAQRDLVLSGELISTALQKVSVRSIRSIDRDVAQPMQQVINQTKQRLIGE